MIQLVVNADDFGLSPGVNAGILEAHRNGIVTSTSLMVRQAAAAEAGALERDYPRLGVGLHVDLAEWVYGDDGWKCAYERVPLSDHGAVLAEVRLQLQLFYQIMGKKPTHIDSHQHVARDGVAGDVVKGIATELGIPARLHSDHIRYCGDFYGQSGHGYPWHEGISAAHLVQTLRELGPGITELGCHPGRSQGLQSVYGIERDMEIEALCDSRVSDEIKERGIRLVSFAEIAA